MIEGVAGETAEATEVRIMRQVTLRLVPQLMLFYMVAYVDRSVLAFAKLQLGADIGLSDTAYGFGAGLFFIGYFLFEVPSNLILARVGARRWFARILVSWGAVTIAMAAIRSPTTFYILRFLLGAAEAGLYPGILYFFTRWYPQRQLGRVLGLFLIAQPVALIVTGPLSGVLLGLDGVAGLRGWQWLFIVSGTPAVLLAIPTLLLLPDGPRAARWLAPSDRAWIEATLRAEAPAGATGKASVLSVLRNPRVFRLALAFLPFPLAIYGVTLWLPTILAATTASPLVIGLLFAVPYVFAALSLCVIPRRSDQTGERHRYVLLSAMLAAAGLAAAAVPGTMLSLAALCVAAFGLYGGQSVFWTLPPRFLHGPAAAVGIAFINAFGNLGGYLGPLAVGAIRDSTGSTSLGMLFLAGSFVLTIVMILIDRAGEDRSGAHSPSRA
jgi:sugar phosphate permease